MSPIGTMAPVTVLRDTEAYYATLLHELTHWMGRERRLTAVRRPRRRTALTIARR